ncbi:LysR family transcriptional regulator [Neokomagataea thailandica]|uniref:LysR family transcriptional regulator n=1 Tax=Neokomagataea tanensis NBRC 106556 TaxID=1223519 RepID=A0ABQ0QGJ7_9PROT|nr:MULTISPECIES: LysR family transcriptional regulator [Neokomagataea]GBR43979.1 LysR family transcriptional regulator [Neokomagataea tanensis NBRC 106556]
MDIKWLEDFLTLSRLQNFSRAAEERHVTQSAFSRRIQALETWVGVPLLDRTRFPITLTSEGRRFRETAEETVRHLLHTRAALMAKPKSDVPTLSVTALHTLSITFFPQWLLKIERAVGKCNSKLLPDDFYKCISAIVDGYYDFFLTFYHESVPIPLSHTQFSYSIIGKDFLVPVNKSTNTNKIDLNNPLLTYSSNSFLGQVCQCPEAQSILPYETSTSRHVNENAMADGIRQMVLAGHGCAWLPKSLIEQDLKANALIPIGKEIPLDIRLYRKIEHTRPIVDQIWQASRQMFL